MYVRVRSRNIINSPGAVAVVAEVRKGSIANRFVEAAAVYGDAICQTDGLIHSFIPPHQCCRPAENLVVVAEIFYLLQILVTIKQFRPENQITISIQD